MNKIITEETFPQCIECKKRINGKAWITVSCNGECVYACRYLCTKYLSNYVGKGYFDRIINKEAISLLSSPLKSFFHNNKYFI